jgi:hypothetical protein
MKAEWSEDVYRKFLGMVQSSMQGPLTMEIGNGEVVLRLAGQVRLQVPEGIFQGSTVHELMDLAGLEINPQAGKR